ncbi:hypothetical protein LCGC14_1960630 [marine sediment metagenome]|uniref:Uncharacterized protein n=1 Tax=marine sediment metagenome TaxID=412755 RepID=A0A0F9FEZ0_9ZZZZ
MKPFELLAEAAINGARPKAVIEVGVQEIRKPGSVKRAVQRTLGEATYTIRTDRGAKKSVLKAILKKDRKAKVDPEGNPVTAWVTTNLSISDIEGIDGVEDVIRSFKQEQSRRRK